MMNSDSNSKEEAIITAVSSSNSSSRSSDDDTKRPFAAVTNSAKQQEEEQQKKKTTTTTTSSSCSSSSNNDGGDDVASLSTLDDDLLCVIFSFLSPFPHKFEGPGKQMVTTPQWLWVAAPLYYNMCLVCRRWKFLWDTKTSISYCGGKVGFCDSASLFFTSLSTPDSVANCLPEQQQYHLKHSDNLRRFFRWLIRLRIQLVDTTVKPNTKLTIVLYTAQDIKLVTDIFTVCKLDMGGCTEMKSFNLRFHHYNNISNNRDHYRLSSDTNKNLGHLQKKLCDAIAPKLPQSVTELDLSLILPTTTPNYSDYISTALLSKPEVKSLELFVMFHPEETPTGGVDPQSTYGTTYPVVDGRLFTNIIQNLPKLERLVIHFGNNELGKKVSFGIVSPTLKVLDLSLFGKGSPIISYVDCPALERISFKVGKEKQNNNFIWKDISREYYNDMVQDISGKAVGSSYSSILPPTMLRPSPPIHLNVPNNCLLDLACYHKWKANEYEEFNQMVKSNVEDSVYETFDDDQDVDADADADTNADADVDAAETTANNDSSEPSK